MKIAYCILCHRYTSILEKTVQLLGKENDIYIHVDAKSDINDFYKIKGNAVFIPDRVDVRWGAFSQVQATINLLKCTRQKKYDYIFLLSGDCLPLKSDRLIKKFLIENSGQEYVAEDYCFKDIDLRIKYKYNELFFEKNKSIIVKFITKLQTKFRMLPLNSYFYMLPQLYKGTQWFGITSELREYIFNYLNNNSWYIEAFKNSFCCDEIFFHTIIFNSKYKENIYKPKDKSNICFQALRYIDWKSGPDFPRILDESDFERIQETECLFARKFSEKINLDIFIKSFID